MCIAGAFSVHVSAEVLAGTFNISSIAVFFKPLVELLFIVLVIFGFAETGGVVRIAFKRLIAGILRLAMGAGLLDFKGFTFHRNAISFHLFQSLHDGIILGVLIYLLIGSGQR